ncbi:MAG TPA: ATP-binding protein [Terracidiphilus sp.]|nr:ATP-binding protein [Terracidiphilus sp.]
MSRDVKAAEQNSLPSSSMLLQQVEKRGLRTRVLLISAMAVIIATSTFVSLLTIRHRLESVLTANLSGDLTRSIATFENLQAQRMNALDRENALLSDLPSLKALMTTSDDRTIEDGAVEFWKVSGNDLFALADRDGRIVAAYADGLSPGANLRSDLGSVLGTSPRPYVVSGNSLYATSVRPLLFGGETGTILGYVISGFVIDRTTLGRLSSATNVDAVFLTPNYVLAGSLAPTLESSLKAHPVPASGEREQAATTVILGGEQFLAVGRDLSARSSAPLELVELKSLAEEQRAIREIDRLVLIAGSLALIIGTVLMTILSRAVTRPLEQLAAGVRAFAAGDSAHILPYRGTMEVRELSTVFAGMRQEILTTNQALLESERLATIGRMASSVSHDLRHYLAAVYANSEFLASGRLTDEERSEILGEIRTAVDGTTELLESLLIFSRTGPGIRRSPQLLATLVDRAVGMVRAHPDAAHVELTLRNQNPAETVAVVDGKQIERAIYNLVLNGCQTAHLNGEPPKVAVSVDVRPTAVILGVQDNGDGVPESIRATLFEPFVSEGKQKGSGLGLTLAQCIAAEHGGDVVLVSSRPGETIFRMSIARGLTEQAAAAAEERTRVRTA